MTLSSAESAPTRRDLATFVADTFGIELSRYSPKSVDILLAALDRVSPEDAEARVRLLISTFSIGETCFMRHAEQLDALRSLVRSIPAMRSAAKLRVWSAGCATGEEAYSLLFVLARELGEYPIEVCGSDVNPEFIERARKGSYRPWSLRGVDREEVSSFLDITNEGATVEPTFVERVRFREQNLVKDPIEPGLHVVFCRNVLMYFKPAAAQDFLRRLAHAVEPGGLLFLGYSDPIPPSDGPWVKEHISGVRYFRRAFPRVSQVAIPKRPLEVPDTSVRAALTLLEGEKREQSARTSPSSKPQVPQSEPQRNAASATAPRPAQKSALSVLETLARDPLFDVDTHVLQAVLADEAGDHQRALSAARKASLLAPDAPFPHFLLARAFSSLGESRRARAHRELARRCLEQCRGHKGALEHAQGLTVAQLARMIDAAQG